MCLQSSNTIFRPFTKHYITIYETIIHTRNCNGNFKSRAILLTDGQLCEINNDSALRIQDYMYKN